MPDWEPERGQHHWLLCSSYVIHPTVSSLVINTISVCTEYTKVSVVLNTKQRKCTLSFTLIIYPWGRDPFIHCIWTKPKPMLWWWWKKSLPWAGIILQFQASKSFMTTMQVIHAHIKTGAYNPTETTELIQLIRKIAVPQKAHNCQIVQNLLPFVNMWLLTAWNRDDVYLSSCMLNPSTIMGFKFQLLPRTNWF